MADLRAKATGPNGAISPAGYQSWLKNRADALRVVPDLRQRLGSVVDAQAAVDQVSADTAAARRTFERSAAQHFLGTDPIQGVQRALAARDPSAAFAELVAQTGGDADARAGLQRAVAEYLQQKFVGNTEAGTTGTGTIKSDAFQTFLRQKGAALGWVFTPEQMSGIRAIAADIQRSNRSIASTKIPGQSNTPQDLAAMAKAGKISYLSAIALPALGGIGGFFAGGLPGAISGAVGAQTVKSTVAAFQRAGIEKADQLLEEALLNPELARTLLMKGGPAAGPLIAPRLASQLYTLSASAPFSVHRGDPAPTPATVH